MPVSSAAHPSPLSNGPNPMASTAPVLSNATLRPSMVRSAGKRFATRATLSSRTPNTTMQNIGSASSFANAPLVPSTNAAPSVTKLPVTWVVNNPCSARKPAASTYPPLTLKRMGKPGFIDASRNDGLIRYYIALKEHVPIEDRGKNKSRAGILCVPRRVPAAAVWSRFAGGGEAVLANAATCRRQDPRASLANRSLQRYSQADPGQRADSLRSGGRLLVRWRR